LSTFQAAFYDNSPIVTIYILTALFVVEVSRSAVMQSYHHRQKRSEALNTAVLNTINTLHDDNTSYYLLSFVHIFV